MKRIIFGVSGASGMPLAREVLASLADVADLEVHLIISAGAGKVLRAEAGGFAPAGGAGGQARLAALAHIVHEPDNLCAPPASGSWRHDGMIVCPCSMRSLAAIATGLGSNLIHRAADVCLKERLPLVLATRETPLSLIHIRNMALATEAGAVIMPFAPAFYTRDYSMPAAMRQFAGRMLDQLRVPHRLCERWGMAEPG